MSRGRVPGGKDMKHMRLLVSAVLMLGLCQLCSACAKNPQGGYVIGLDTLVEGMRTGKLVVNEPGAGEAWPGSGRKMDIPALQEGQLRLYGTLESDGMFYCGKNAAQQIHGDLTGVGWDGNGPFGVAGTNGGWFYADIDAATGEIVRAQAYFYGEAPAGSEAGADFQQKFNGSYGYVKNGKFAIGVSGQFGSCPTGHYAGREVPEWPDWHKSDERMVIRGTGDPLKAADGATFKVQFYVGVKSLDQKVGKPVDCDIAALGQGVARVQRYK